MKTSSPLLLFLTQSHLWISLLFGFLIIGSSGCGKEDSSLRSPTITSPDNGAMVKNCVTIFWTRISDAESYLVEIAHDTEFNNIVFQETIAGTQNNLLYPATIDADSLLYIRVNASKTEAQSDWSDIVMVRPNFTILSDCTLPLPSIPALELPINQNLVPRSVNFQWENVLGAEEYEFELYFALDENTRGDGVRINSGTPNNRVVRVTNTYQVSGLQVGQSYFWRVRAKGNNCTTDWSRQWFFTVVS